ncbi:Oxidase ustYa [Pseudocercospora fuligena]|uniref:Oxidase ustYa n=1 Tax=Pseudocercospora fuligena TaxID=685502 RepID=A0A8H6RU08_9PEZI|nr:Oxidase ustYa [Pseudocercospora fuligena]
MADSKYSDIPIHDRERLLGSDSEAADVSLESQRPWKRSLPWILNAVLGILVAILAIQLWKVPRDQYQHTGDVNGIAPRFSQKLVKFMPEPRTHASIGHPDKKKETDDFWLTFAPAGFGLLDIKDYSPGKYPKLAKPTIKEGYNVVDTSMAHQLHCLHSIMDAYNQMAQGLPPHHGGHMIREEDHSWHLGHCFDYIRQGIMCCGDTALEGAATMFPEGKEGSDGWNTYHVCKAYPEVKGWIEDMMFLNHVNATEEER